MARLVRCDRCNKELSYNENASFSNVELPTLNKDDCSGDVKGFDFCFECLRSLWDWLRQGQK